MINEEVTTKIYTLLAYLGIDQANVELTLHEAEPSLEINLQIPEDQAGIYIGHFAETLEGIQRLISAFVNNGRTEHLPVLLDIAGYRQKRLAKLQSIADTLAQEVLDSGLPRAFPGNLSATERRQIHLLFKDDQKLTTYSEGYGATRRLYLGLHSA
jgi:spoIIIJ-associated protein